MIGKIRVAHAPWMNHGWHVALQPNARGLGIVPTAASGGRTFTLTLDLCRHAIVLWISDGGREELPLNAGSIAALHKQPGGDARAARPSATSRRTAQRDRRRRPFATRTSPAATTTAIRRSASARRWARCCRRSRGSAPASPGKASPVHFWWGSFDLAVSRFSGSGRAAPSGRSARLARPDHARSL